MFSPPVHIRAYGLREARREGRGESRNAAWTSNDALSAASAGLLFIPAVRCVLVPLMGPWVNESCTGLLHCKLELLNRCLE